ncbi:DgyrCDS2588 [Dimorphilus gyrociliatus]|uniref:DgyrCDS2588 n=1 Tax=Dimorphilus gyrociliatus TaxID=2664684 RepID=A0A7I8VDJ8_9ANNE|nr:DgyrCDS2588 [Dimorphilus gyrociliatus]
MDSKKVAIEEELSYDPNVVNYFYLIEKYGSEARKKMAEARNYRRKETDHVISPGSLIRFKLSKAYKSMEKQEVKAWSKPNVQKVRVKKKRKGEGSISVNDSMTYHSDKSKDTKSKSSSKNGGSLTMKGGSQTNERDGILSPPPGDPNENWDYVRKALPSPEDQDNIPVFRRPIKEPSEGVPVEVKWKKSTNQWSEMVRSYHSRKLISATTKLSSRAPSPTPIYSYPQRKPTPKPLTEQEELQLLLDPNRAEKMQKKEKIVQEERPKIEKNSKYGVLDKWRRGNSIWKQMVRVHQRSRILAATTNPKIKLRQDTRENSVKDYESTGSSKTKTLTQRCSSAPPVPFTFKRIKFNMHPFGRADKNDKEKEKKRPKSALKAAEEVTTERLTEETKVVISKSSLNSKNSVKQSISNYKLSNENHQDNKIPPRVSSRCQSRQSKQTESRKSSRQEQRKISMQERRKSVMSITEENKEKKNKEEDEESNSDATSTESYLSSAARSKSRSTSRLSNTGKSSQLGSKSASISGQSLKSSESKTEKPKKIKLCRFYYKLDKCKCVGSKRTMDALKKKNKKVTCIL